MRYKATPTLDMKMLLALAILLAGIITGIILVQQQQELRKRASTSEGSVFLAAVPSSGTIYQGTQGKIQLLAATASTTSVDGFQVIAHLTGTIPPMIYWVSDTIPGTSVVKGELVDDGSGGKLLRMALITTDPTQPIVLSKTYLGYFYFPTIPASGTMTLSFDEARTIIAEHGSTKDVLMTPQTQTYTFAPAATATPTRRPTPTPTPRFCPRVKCPDGQSAVQIGGKCSCKPNAPPIE